MDIKEYILTQLRDGISSEDLARDIVDSLNEATSDYEEEQLAAQQAAEEEALQEQKMEYANDIAEALTYFIFNYYDNTPEDFELTGEDIIAVTDTAMNATSLFKGLGLDLAELLK